MQCLFCTTIPSVDDSLIGVREDMPLGILELEYARDEDDSKEYVEDTGRQDRLCI